MKQSKPNKTSADTCGKYLNELIKNVSENNYANAFESLKSVISEKVKARCAEYQAATSN